MSRAKQLLGAIALLCFALFSCVQNASTRFFTWPWVFYGQLTLLLPIALLGADLLLKPATPNRRLIPILVVALSIAVSVFFSPRPGFSIEVALFLWSGLATCGLVYRVVGRSLASESGDQFLPIARVVGLCMTLPVLCSLAYWAQEWFDKVPPQHGFSASVHSLLNFRNLHPFGHWNFTAGFSLLTTSWICALVWMERGYWRVSWALCLLASLIAFVSASSRGAVLGLLASVAAAVLIAVATHRISRKQTLWLALSAVAVCAVFWFSNARLRELVLSPAVTRLRSEGDIQRFEMLQGGWLLAKQRPWIGHGPGITPFVYPTVRAQLAGGVETSFQLHNGPLQLWVDHGLLGLLTTALSAIAVLLGCMRWIRTRDCALRPFAFASACALAGYAVVFATDYQLNILAFVTVLGLYAGIVLAGPSENEPVSHASRLICGGLALAFVVILIVLVPNWRARQHYESAWSTDDANERVALLEQTVALAPHHPYYLNQLALQRGKLAQKSTDAAAAAKLRAIARQELNRSLALDAAQEPVESALGWLWLPDDPKQAETHFRKAIALLPDRDTVHFGLALSLLGQNKSLDATRQLALECLSNPLFIASPFWQQEPFKSLSTATIRQLLSDYQRALESPHTPPWRKPHFVYAAAFTRWWLGGAEPTNEELNGALPSQRDFFTELARPAPAKEADDNGPLWKLLERAQHEPDRAQAILRRAYFPPSDLAISAALERIAHNHTNFSALLRNTEPCAIGYVGQEVTREHYAIMNNILDGPGYPDLAPRLIDVFVVEFASALFPQRAAVPGPLMIELMSQK
ncbi:MAG: O-antigen ligase family protein [Nibricoccus sp.]